MDITVYLPDELGQWAKAAGVNLSGELRRALLAERRRQEETAATLANASEHLLSIEDGDLSYMARLSGTVIAEQGDTTVFVIDGGEVVVYDEGQQRLWRDVDVDDLSNFVSGDEYIEACNAVGVEPVIDIEAMS